jgi:adhesin/invasin
MYNARSDTTITVSGDGKTATSNAFAVGAAQVASVAVTPSAVTLGPGAPAALSAQARDAYGNPITGATYLWSLGNLSIGTLVPSANTATFTSSSLAATATGAVGVTATYGGATVSTSATVTVNPA